MSEDQFTKLFKYMEEFRSDVNKRFDETNERIDNVMNAVMAFAKQQEISDEERLVMGHQLDRLDAWVHQLADKIGVTLSA
jgi:DNA-binding ferritin-like protein